MKFIIRHIRGLIFIFAAISLLGGIGLASRTFRSRVNGYVNTLSFPSRPNPHSGVEVIEEEFYVDGVQTEVRKPISGRDNKIVQKTEEGVRLYDYANGFAVMFPYGVNFDFSKSKKYITAYSSSFCAVISREWSVEEDVEGYVGYYFNRFILDSRFREENGILLLNDEGVDRISVQMENAGDHFDTYTYLIFQTGSRYFYRVALKYNGNDSAMEEVIDRIINSFQYFKAYGKAVYKVDFKPEPPDYWTDETKALYEKISNINGLNDGIGNTDMMWGIFTKDITSKGIEETIPEMEGKLEYKFDIVLVYAQLNEAFPMEFMERCYAENRLVELTYQLSANNNEDLYANSALLNIYRTGDDSRIREFARQAKAFGHPFLFRLNNEMNSDWTSYGGVNNLLDPDIYIEVWRRVFEIFKEEGVNNAIWIFNPNDRDYPPNNWNSFIAYYPGNEYVHILGVTGYNNGTYYKDVTGEYWREFDDIYGRITAEYNGVFDSFPWIITEFSSSSHGGDKAKWIKNMFKALPRYPQIKASVWFSYADYDFRPEYSGAVARPYWLDETEETLEAFKKGIDGM